MSNYAFIDSQNLNLAVQDMGWKIDFWKLRTYLRGKYQIEKAFLFMGYIPKNEDKYENLQKLGYILIFKPTLQLPNGQIKGNVDAELVLHTMIEYRNYKKAIIISNDGDFYCLIKYLDKMKKLLKVLTPSYRYSSLLKDFANYIVPIPLFRHKLEKRGIPAAMTDLW